MTEPTDDLLTRLGRVETLAETNADGVAAAHARISSTEQSSSPNWLGILGLIVVVAGGAASLSDRMERQREATLRAEIANLHEQLVAMGRRVDDGEEDHKGHSARIEGHLADAGRWVGEVDARLEIHWNAIDRLWMEERKRTIADGERWRELFQQDRGRLLDRQLDPEP